MAINKVVLGERTLIDLSLDTATEADVVKGKYFHRADGEIVEGTLEGSGGGGGGGGGVLVESDVNFYDYDGTLLYAYPRAGVMAMTELPEPPTHEGLTFQEWNWTLEEIKAYEGPVNVGATYITDDGKTRFYITLDDIAQAYVRLCFVISYKGDTVVINWGDGTGNETYTVDKTPTGRNYNTRTFGHTYETTGDYVITVESVEKICLGYDRRSVFNVSDFNGSSALAHSILRKLEIGNVSYFGIQAFYGFQNLKYVTIPRGVQEQDHSGATSNNFINCISLESVTLPRGFYSLENMFKGCTRLKSVLIPGNMSYSLGKSMLESCTSISALSFSSKMTSTGENSLKDSGLKKIFVPKNITTISPSTFYNCSNLEEVTLRGVTTISNSAFYGCKSLRGLDIPDSVTSIGNSAFSQCAMLSDIRIPSGVTAIGNNTFEYCKLLFRLVLPDSVQSIGSGAFKSCTSLVSINIPEGVPSLNESVFENCFKLQEAEIPTSVTSIGKRAFMYCQSMKSIVISEGVTSIGEEAFRYCSGLTTIEIPESVTSLGSSVFRDCTSLTSAIVRAKAPNFYSYMFDGCKNLTTVELSIGLTSIGTYVFNGCEALTSINLPDGVTSISNYAFQGCKSLTSINIPDGMKSFGQSAFKDCTSLAAVVMPASVTSIGLGAFYGCKSLEYVDFSKHTAVPTLANTTVFYNSPCEIRVPAALYDEWIAATNWSSVASKIVAV